jgi:hypothetical protein
MVSCFDPFALPQSGERHRLGRPCLLLLLLLQSSRVQTILLAGHVGGMFRTVLGWSCVLHGKGLGALIGCNRLSSCINSRSHGYLSGCKGHRERAEHTQRLVQLRLLSNCELTLSYLLLPLPQVPCCQAAGVVPEKGAAAEGEAPRTQGAAHCSRNRHKFSRMRRVLAARAHACLFACWGLVYMHEHAVMQLQQRAFTAAACRR